MPKIKPDERSVAEFDIPLRQMREPHLSLVLIEPEQRCGFSQRVLCEELLLAPDSAQRGGRCARREHVLQCSGLPRADFRFSELTLPK